MIPKSEAFAEPITRRFSEITDKLLINIARHFNVNDEDLATPEWGQRKASEANKVYEESVKIIRDGTKGMIAEIDQAIKGAAQSGIDHVEPQLLEAEKRGFLKSIIEANTVIGTAAILSIVAQRSKDVETVARTIASMMTQEATAAYRKAVSSAVVYASTATPTEAEIISRAVSDVLGGRASRVSAVRKAVREMNDAGITGHIDKAGKKWSAEAYVNMNVRTTCGNTSMQAAFARNEQYGNDLIWWPILATARPGCYPYQGKVCSTSGRSGTVEDLDGNRVPFISIYSTTYGEPAGIGGINCHHKPPNIFVPGMSKVRGEVPPKEENDERYEESQKQRYYERQVRYAKRDAAEADAMGDKEAFADQAKKVKTAQAKLNSFVEESGRTPRPDRTQVLGYTKSTAAKAKGVKS